MAARKKSSTGKFHATWDGKTLKVTPRWPQEIYDRGLIFKVVSRLEEPWEIQRYGKGKKKRRAR